MMKLLAVSSLAVTAICGAALAQALPEGRVYTFHSSPRGTCPSLDWHVVVGTGGVLNGMISWNDMQSMARASGTVQSGQFQMTATEVAGPNPGRTANITGNVNASDGWLTANIDGPNVKCNGIKVPWFTPPPSGNG
jgi:hypothetical protein